MVSRLMGALTWDEQRDIAEETAHWPNDPKRFTPLYNELQKDVQTVILHQRIDAEWEDIEVDNIPTRRAITDTAKRWTKALLKTGTLLDRPPHPKGYRLAKSAPYLQPIRDIILAGHLDSQGNVTIFRNLAEVQAKVPEFQELMDATGCKTLKGLWGHLKAMYPRLNKVNLRLKKLRDHQKVQVCDPCKSKS